MRQIAFATMVAACMGLPLHAQDEEDDDGLSLMERGAQMFFEGIMREMEPALDDLRDMAEDLEPALREFVEEMGPAFADLLGKIDDLNAYHPPEILPNGDIIIRRKTPAEMEQEDEIEI